MNLHGIAAPLVGIVNPFIPATLRQSTGYTTTSDGTQVPTYADTTLLIQVQGLSGDELRQLEGLNIQGNKSAVYLGGNWNGVVRASKQGGDLVMFNNQTWLAVTVLEQWPDWCKLAVVLQDGG